jgi:hypothetical protein
MKELPGGRGSRCVASRRRIEAPAAFHVLTSHPPSSMPSCRIDGMGCSKSAYRPASRSLQGLTPSWRSHRTSLRRRDGRACGGWAAASARDPVLVYASVPASVAFKHLQQAGSGRCLAPEVNGIVHIRSPPPGIQLPPGRIWVIAKQRGPSEPRGSRRRGPFEPR